MRITKEQAEQNRLALLQAASRLFQERGISGVGVADISKAAGLTHGALYAHFPSKDALAAAALGHGMVRRKAQLGKLAAEGRFDLGRYLDDYLSPAHCDNLAESCPMAASASEAGRQDAALSAEFSAGYQRLADAFAQQLAHTRPAARARSEALAMVAGLVGSVAMARATAKADPALSAEILAATRAVLGQLCNAAPASVQDNTACEQEMPGSTLPQAGRML